jgi:hypothetical protein
MLDLYCGAESASHRWGPEIPLEIESDVLHSSIPGCVSLGWEFGCNTNGHFPRTWNNLVADIRSYGHPSIRVGSISYLGVRSPFCIGIPASSLEVDVVFSYSTHPVFYSCRLFCIPRHDQ